MIKPSATKTKKNVFSKVYTLYSDGFYYCEETLEGLDLLIPMYASRIDSRPKIKEWELTGKGKRPGYSVGWNVRITRKGEPTFRRYIKDSDFLTSKVSKKESSVQASVRKSLAAALAEIKILLKTYRSHEKAKSDVVLSRVIFEGKDNKNGLTVSFCPSNLNNGGVNSPSIMVSCQQGSETLSSRKNIFEWTPVEFKRSVRNIARYRKYLERQYENGKKPSKRGFDHIPLADIKVLDDKINETLLPDFDYVMSLIESKLGSPSENPSKTIGFERIVDEGKSGYKVCLNPVGSERSYLESVFWDESYKSKELARKFALWYAEQLTRYPDDYISAAGKPKGVRSAVKSRKTGLIGLSYQINKANTLNWISIIYPEDVTKRSRYKYFSATEHGFKEGFVKAWGCYLKNEGKPVESRTATLIRLNYMKPLLIKGFSQAVIDRYSLKSFFEGK